MGRIHQTQYLANVILGRLVVAPTIQSDSIALSMLSVVVQI